MIFENAHNIRRRIAEACGRCGRKTEEITLVAVTKTFGVDVIKEALSAGMRDFGENYVNEFCQKYAEFSGEDIRWHFIGHLQRNKVKEIIGKTTLIHSVDSVRLAEEISRRAEASGRNVDVLIEVNTSGEESKFGAQPEETASLVTALAKIPNISVSGLMTIGPFLADPELSRPAFRLLRELRDAIQKDGIAIPHLSMGMTNDFEIAIEEGATIIRVGTALFGTRQPKI
jgi:pyridoxal phosphate enzyme (YggS family)